LVCDEGNLALAVRALVRPEKPTARDAPGCVSIAQISSTTSDRITVMSAESTMIGKARGTLGGTTRGGTTVAQNRAASVGIGRVVGRRGGVSSRRGSLDHLVAARRHKALCGDCWDIDFSRLESELKRRKRE